MPWVRFRQKAKSGCDRRFIVEQIDPLTDGIRRTQVWQLPAALQPAALDDKSFSFPRETRRARNSFSQESGVSKLVLSTCS